jgi:hypothetical protein
MRINLDKFIPNHNHIVCSIHFTQEDFENRYMKDLLPNEKIVRKLKETALLLTGEEEPIASASGETVHSAELSEVHSTCSDVEKDALKSPARKRRRRASVISSHQSLISSEQLQENSDNDVLVHSNNKYTIMRYPLLNSN